MNAPRVTGELALRELQKRDFSVLSTISEDGKSHSAGVNYGVSSPGCAVAIYVMTQRHLRKARNVARNPHISLVSSGVTPGCWGARFAHRALNRGRDPLTVVHQFLALTAGPAAPELVG